MRCIAAHGATIELNTMWLPTWIGLNAALIKQLEAELQPLVVGRELTEKTLDEVNALVLEHLTEKFKVPGLFKYLDALKFIEM